MKTLSFSVIVFPLSILLCYGKLAKAEAVIDEYFDAFDEVRTKVDSLNIDNCVESDEVDLFLSNDTLTLRLNMSEDFISPIPQNQAAMMPYNMAISRAFFWSYILQSRFIRPTYGETYDPGMLYYFLSAVADVASSPSINASSMYFSPDKFYTSSYKGFFNKTLPRFAPRAYKSDYLNGNVDSHALVVEDLGVFDLGVSSKDYTSPLYRTNEWYKLWLPDTEENSCVSKIPYQVEIRYENNTNETFTFFGPPEMEENSGPVKWTRPYYDCERLNNWLVGAVSPVVDLYPRHTNIKNIEKPTHSAVVVLEVDYELIDINQCPAGTGNQKPNYFASTAKCNETTELCAPLHGWGFNRGGYQCRCVPGYRPLESHRDNRHIEGIESVNKFECVKIDQPLPLPLNSKRVHPSVRTTYLSLYPEYVKPKRGAAALHVEKLNIHEFLKYIRKVKPTTCSTYHRSDLNLDHRFAYGASQQLKNQATMAVRLANFISAYLQINDPEEKLIDHDRLTDKALTDDQLYGEALAILTDLKILSAGTFWDRNKYPNRTFFAPFAYKTQLNTTKYKLDDLAQSKNTFELYTQETWFKNLKQRFSNNFDDLEKFYIKIKMRQNLIENQLKRFVRYPVIYQAANINHGYWTSPYYDCDGPLKQWVLKFAVPFFGWDQPKVKLEFKGVVAVTMSLESLDINQCPDQSSAPNAFKGTDKCDKETTHCVHVPGYSYNDGGYRCECLPGYEYPYDEPTSYYDGVRMETEFLNIISNKLTIFDNLKCRPVNNSKYFQSETPPPLNISASTTISNI